MILDARVRPPFKRLKEVLAPAPGGDNQMAVSVGPRFLA